MMGKNDAKRMSQIVSFQAIMFVVVDPSFGAFVGGNAIKSAQQTTIIIG